MKGGVTKRLEDTVKALSENKIKKALNLTDKPELARQHGWVVEAAQTCLAHRGDKKTCDSAIKVAKEKILQTTTLPEDSEGLEGVAEMIGHAPEADISKPKVVPEPECEECQVAVAAAEVSNICADHPEESGGGCAEINANLANPDCTPAQWIRSMVKAADGATGEARTRMDAAITELEGYLEKRQSPILKELEDRCIIIK